MAQTRCVAAALTLLLLVGCGSIQRPTAAFKTMSIGDVTARGFMMNVDVDVANPNPVAIPLTNADYTLSLGGIRVIESAKVKPAASIPASGHSTISIPIPLSFENLLSAEEAIRKGGGDVTYGLDAAFDFDTGLPVIGNQRVPLRHEGTLNVKELLSKNWGTILSSPAAKELAQKVLGGMFKF
jgi:LEA14-like dessication related protein